MAPTVRVQGRGKNQTGCDLLTVLVAHPDDETIWASGLIQRTDCKIVCCTIPHRDPERAEQFLRACQVHGREGTIYSRPEKPGDEIDLNGIDVSGLIASHGATGETGHKHHIQVYNRFSPDIAFGYRGSGAFKLKLTAAERLKKLEAMACYTAKYKDYLDIFPDVFIEETYDALSAAGYEILSALCGPVPQVQPDNAD